MAATANSKIDSVKTYLSGSSRKASNIKPLKMFREYAYMRPGIGLPAETWK
jgi:hypothetical protein